MKNDNEQLRNSVRLNLINLRVQNNFTQSEIAKKVGKSVNAVGSWEQGLSLPDIPTLYRLSRLYCVTLEYFFENDANGGESK